MRGTVLPGDFTCGSASTPWWFPMSTQVQELDRSTLEEITRDWPEKPTELTNKMIDQYGLPDEVTDRRFYWHNVGEWKRIQVYRDGTPHNFPKQHKDHLRQTINYPIDPEYADELLAFDGSNVLWRTRGELSADCHKEPMNVLTFNLAHDIVTGEKSVDEARQAFAEIAVKKQMGMDPDYTQALLFDVPDGDQGDPDESIVTDTLKQDVEETVEDVTGGS